MKTKNLFRLSALLFAFVTISFTACQKETIDEGSSDSSSLVQLSRDENNVEAILDDASKDVEGVMMGQGGYKSTSNLPCNATIDSASVVNDTITIYITYNGLNCNGTRNRSGQIVIRKKVGTHWGQEGATIQITYNNFTVTRVSNGKTTILNGTKIHQNVTGGFIWQVGNTVTSVVHRASGTLNIVFDDGTSRTWNLARQRTYTGTQDQLIMTVDGFGTEGDYSNLVSWGTNRAGEQFYTQITQSVVHREACDWDPVSGIKIHHVPARSKTATITYGFNDNNEPISGDECPTRYRIDWTNGTHSGTSYLELR